MLMDSISVQGAHPGLHHYLLRCRAGVGGRYRRTRKRARLRLQAVRVVADRRTMAADVAGDVGPGVCDRICRVALGGRRNRLRKVYGPPFAMVAHVHLEFGGLLPGGIKGHVWHTLIVFHHQVMVKADPTRVAPRTRGFSGDEDRQIRAGVLALGEDAPLGCCLKWPLGKGISERDGASLTAVRRLCNLQHCRPWIMGEVARGSTDGARRYFRS
jgi:hypothetical protein